ncbi:lysine transporter LysE [Geobacillus sp. NFOSA3]|jgi:threonine/homoserine/homoserine lactone efflux protein|uniref:Lysine transporter LysE n=1 Tax=Parageobacillus galactosidasius TaxID=883812 RepID=A0A226QHM1_9BACL|nr:MULTISPECIES: LysE family transporter [Parageobacillus]NNU94563.1 lysine transporter LysE [Geobacillus sp. NFOSA3]QNU34496.1 LysE family transporter [Geobacillus sp. 44C]MED4971258.1 LysE family transporter [Parageobacillus toebii]MED4988431.1 LysE family transporter [Parageobacillus toebii]OXB91865.1 lysine transporter LysE [Parageobacillus galactosidasius]
MLNSFLSSILLGLSLSIPIGPINIEMIKRGIKFGFFHSWVVGLGGMSADLVLMFAIFFGLSTFLTQSVMQFIMWLSGFLILCYLGYESIKEAFKKVEISGEVKKESLSKSYLSGFLIALSNPLNIVFWVSIYGSVLAIELNSVERYQALIESSAIFLGIALWDFTVALSVHLGRKMISQKWLKWLSVAAGISLVGFGISFGYRAFKTFLHMI